MSQLLAECSDYYNYVYKHNHHNFYEPRRWMFQPFIHALIKKAQLPEQSQIIDLGCGGGFFTSLFGNLGFRALGVDLSAEGIKSAQQQYSSTDAKFEVGDALSLPTKIRSIAPSYAVAPFITVRILGQTIKSPTFSSHT